MPTAPKYTKKDMKTLADMSREGSPAKVFIEEAGYDPIIFRETLKQYHLTKDIYFLYEVPLGEVPLLINKGEISGYLRFRLTIGK